MSGGFAVPRVMWGTSSVGFVGGAAWTQLAKIVVTRPNNVTAYAIGNVWGATPSALITIPVGGAAGQQIALKMNAVNNRPSGDPAISGLIGYLFSEAPAAIDDNAPLDLADADIDKMFTNLFGGIAAASSFSLGFGAGVPLNVAAAPNGRRGSTGPMTTVLNFPTSADGNAYLYLVAGAAYVPIANETITFYPSILRLA